AGCMVRGRRRGGGGPVGWRRTVPFTGAFRSPPAQVIETVETGLRAAEIPEVAPAPAPHCLLLDFNESDARYCVRYWLQELATDDRGDSEVRAHVYYALKRAGIPLSIPAHALFLTEETPERRAGKEARDRVRRVDAVQ